MIHVWTQKWMPRKVHFQVVYSSSSDDQFPATELNHHGPLVQGWQSQRFCPYSQELILQFDKHVRVRRVQLLSHQHLIASRIEFFIGDCLNDEEMSSENAKYSRLGYIELSSNERTEFKARELKSIHVDAEGLFLKLLIHKNYVNRLNPYNQVSIVAINLIGDDADKFDTHSNNENQYNEQGTVGTNRSDQISIIDDLAFAMYQDPEIAVIIKNLDKKKQEAVNEEKFEQARKFKQAIQELIKVGERLARYDVEKRQAIENEDYETAQQKKDKMELYRAETYKQLQMLNLLDIVIEGGEGAEFLKRLQNSEVVHNDSDTEKESPRSLKQHNQGRTRTNRHSPDSTASFGTLPTHEKDTSVTPLPPVSNTRRKSLHENNGGDGGHSSGGSVSPDYQKPPTPYEDKIIPTLRNRSRVDGPPPTDNNISEETGATFGNIPQPNEDATSELTNAEMREANQMMDVFDKQLIGKLYNRNYARREEALDEIYQIVSTFNGDNQEANSYLRAGSFVVARMFRDNVFSIFSSSLKLFHLLMNDYIRKHQIQRQDIISSIERVLPVLIQRTGDTNGRLRQRAQDAIVETASYPEIKPLHIIPHHCVMPFNKTIAPRLALSRCEVLEELMKILQLKDNGLNVDNVSKFCAQALEHTAGEVRELATKLLLNLYKVENGTIVRKNLPADNEQTRKIKKYRDIFDAFDRVDNRTTKTEDKALNDTLEKVKKNPEPESSKRETKQVKDIRNQHQQQLQQLQQQKAFDLKSSLKSRTPTKFDRKTPTTSVADESEFNPDNTCIFCGEKNEKFVNEGLEQHYWSMCPMLTRCKECNQVIEIATQIDHLLSECTNHEKYSQCLRCNEAILKTEYEKHTKLKECHEAKLNTNRCPLCHNNIDSNGEQSWRDHLMSVDGCVKNPRRELAIKKNKEHQQPHLPSSQKAHHQQQQSPAVNVMKKPNTKKVTVK
ncbi:unnamed protein product [Didymodactylos carnosus]|uniref:UVR domain-containing protein n=1 Tax=Didymodactylos carnosus TaxID=1234261 RepID=A0A8S2CVX3_9BILA|nr:unnamed protein product [Didymodactylos carnosus]CAF3600949.1 unnamed protein product [Didymodactylos carnosus]